MLSVVSTVVIVADIAPAACRSQSRIEKTQTSGTLLETVGMARNIDLTAERERGEAARAATKKARDNGVDGVAGTRSRYAPLCGLTIVRCCFSNKSLEAWSSMRPPAVAERSPRDHPAAVGSVVA